MHDLIFTDPRSGFVFMNKDAEGFEAWFSFFFIINKENFI